MKKIIVEKKEQTPIKTKPKEELKQEKVEKNKKDIKKIVKKIPVLSLQIDMNNLNSSNSTTKQSKPLTQGCVTSIKTEEIKFDKALDLAQLYFDTKDYENSIKWCKIASKLNNKDERVWKLYALNLDRIGDTEKAIHILKTYLKYKNSLDLQYLLQRLEK